MAFDGTNWSAELGTHFQKSGVLISSRKRLHPLIGISNAGFSLTVAFQQPIAIAAELQMNITSLSLFGRK